MKFNKKLILASASPRRKELLSTLGLEFKIKVADINEDLNIKNPKKLVLELAKAKALKIRKTNRDATIIAADTVVVIGKKILGKPKDAQEAKEFFRLLSGRRHKVITGIYVINEKGKFRSKAVTTKVRFSQIDGVLLRNYIATKEWEDAAGGYKIQGQSQGFIKSINGSYSNVVGLPLNEIYGILLEMDYPLK